MIEWPWKLLNPNVERWWLSGVAARGGQTVGGSIRLAKLDGGGLWLGEQSFYLHCPDQVRAARAIEAAMDGGVNPVVAFSYEDAFSPLPSALTPHSDGTPFDDTGLYEGPGFSLNLAAPAALRATMVQVVGEFALLRGGEHFSIDHPVHGLRRYRIVRVEGDQVEIRPPLREAVPAGAVLDLSRVGCVVRLANPDEFFGALQVNHHTTVTAQWVEAFDAS